MALLAGLMGCSFVESVLFIIADASVELSMRCLEPLMIMPLAVAFDVLDLWLAFLCLIAVVTTANKWGKSASVIAFMTLLWVNTPYGSHYHFFYKNRCDMRIKFLPVGQGDSTLIEWGDGEVWLVDGGPFTFDLVPYLKRHGIWRLDRVWLSHPHADHMDGLFPVLNDMDVASLVVGRVLEQDEEGG